MQPLSTIPNANTATEPLASGQGAGIQRFHVSTRYSEAAVFNGVVYLAGTVPECTELDIRSQTANVLSQIDERLAEVGSDKAHLLRVQIYLSHISDIVAMNEVWDAWVPAGHAPPRATVEARLARADWKIEVVVTAAQR
jgi:enamine deaminase RidA (YjgF/YER057c/UK114 family)